MSSGISYQYERAVPFFEDAEDFCESLCKLEEAVNGIKGDVSEGDAWKLRRLDVNQQRRAELFKDEVDDIIDDPYKGTYRITYFYPPGENVFFQAVYQIRDRRWTDVFEAIGHLLDAMGQFSIAVHEVLADNKNIENGSCHEAILAALKADRQEKAQEGFENLFKKFPSLMTPLRKQVEKFLSTREGVYTRAKDLRKTIDDEEKSRRQGLAQIIDAINDIISSASVDPTLVPKGMEDK